MSKLFIGNIPFSSSEVDVQEWIERRGFAVATTEIIRDRTTGTPRGFGFVLLRDESKTREAIKTLHGQVLNSRPLTVNEAHPLVTRSGGQ
jgi:RNA recognition motif-containing protein